MVKKIITILCITFSVFISAQTTGPSQPEVLSSPAISGNGMVDKYTGNLNYNIPLLVVPGPDGGFGIKMGYTASPSVNNVPTWVGYNWNINTGVIVRNKRGIPDDFNGDTLQKTVYQKDKWNIGIGVSPTDMEIFGADLGLKGEFTMYYDNYAGFGVKAGASLAPLNEAEKGKENMMSKGAWSLGLDFDSKTGVSLSPSLSLDHLLDKKEKDNSKGKENQKNKGLGKIINSTQGVYDKIKSFNSFTYCDNNYSRYDKTDNFSLSFSKHAPLPTISIPRSTISTEFAATFDSSLPFLKNKSITLKGNFSISKITEPNQEIPMYGSMYSSQGQANNDGIMDSYRDNDTPISKESPFLAIAVNSFDVFSINADGIGGSFRLYRNEVGQFKPQLIETKATNIEIGADFGAGAGTFDIGTDLKFAHSKSYTGKWKNPNRINSLNDYKFSKKTVSKPLYEPTYFKLIGESYPLPLDEYKNMDYDNPIAFDIGNWTNTIEKPLSFKAKAFSTYNNGKTNLDVNNKNERKPRTSNIEYKTREEVRNARNRNEGIYQEKHIISGNNIIPINYTKGADHHINQITVRKSNGSVYNFALPAYNIDEKKVVFSTKQADIDGDKRVPYTSQDASVNNDNGDDNYFSEEITPAYVHSYFLTSIQSLDYIDVKNDGYTEDDLGSYTLFIYKEVEDYHWRFPFKSNEANFIDGYNDNDEDNKATFTQGVKNLYYVSVIETKTHIAVFDIDDSALTESGPQINTQKYLKKISLYSKSDPNYKDEFYLESNHGLSPIKEVHFNYDYSLKSTISSASTIPNFKSSIASSDNITATIGSNGQKGTLTLKELYFTYKKNQTGKDSRYQFEYNTKYNGTDIAFPSNYSEDRWGNYQPNIGKYKSYENPYTYQKESKILKDEKAGLWSLNKITLPSNGTIKIDYEKDDYKFVQDKKAMEYVKIIGIGYNNGSIKKIESEEALLSPIAGVYPDKIFIDAKNEDEVKKRVHGIKNIGFKTYMYLNTTKKINGNSKKSYYDYVSGYLERQKNDNDQYENVTGTQTINGTDYYYIELDAVKPTNFAQYHINPFQVAAIQYLRNYRPDLQESFELTSSNPIKFTTDNLEKLLKAVKPLFKGYVKDKASKGWGSYIKEDKPSFLRLNSIDRKFGGDNRVKQVKLYPDPSNKDIYYGKEYQYTLEDGTSSGVAEMEPITGHEENGIVQPKWYQNETGEKFLYFLDDKESAFVETPFGTSFLPAANVGYSRVIERSLSPNDLSENVDKTQDGITISEFYTAKDFSTKNKITENPFRSIIKPINIHIPFIGDLSINNAGFTQGASFTINNAIYGKQKRIAVYPYSKKEPKGEPVSEVEYIYKTNVNKTLNNKVKFLKKEGVVEEAYLGKEYDFYLEQYESGTTTIGGGVKPDIKFTPLAIPWPSLWPTFQYMESTSSYITTTKVIYNSPILEKTIQYKDGSKVISSPEYYDYETGNPIINSVTNEFGNKIYSYSFPAQWSYPRMKGAYKNFGAQLQVYNSSNGRFKLPAGQLAGAILFDGDEIILKETKTSSTTKKYYVSDINIITNDFKLTDRENNIPTINSFYNPLDAQSNNQGVNVLGYIDRSGYRNLQSVSKGSIESLDDYSSYSFPDSDILDLDYLLSQYNIQKSNFTVIPRTLGYNVHRGVLLLNDCETEIGFGLGFEVIPLELSDPRYTKDKPYLVYLGVELKNDNNNQNPFCNYKIPLGFSNSDRGFPFTKMEIDKFEYNASLSNDFTISFDFSGSLFLLPISERTFSGPITQNCQFECNRNAVPILQANAVEFTEDFTPNFNTLPQENTDISGETLTTIYQNNAANPYAFGVKGIPRSLRTWAYIESRQQKGTLGEGLRNDKDGEFDYYPFNWKESSIYNENYNWRWVNEITQYNANGSSEEGKNRLEMFSTNLFGYKNLLVTAAAQNAEHNDIVYDGFEDYDGLKPVVASTYGNAAQYRDLNHGNLDIPLQNNTLAGIAHTGDWGLLINNDLIINTNSTKYFKPTKKKYIISAWVYMGDVTIFSTTVKLKGGEIEVYENANPTPIAILRPDIAKNNVIDGWIKIEGEFEPSSPNSNITFKLIPALLNNNEKGSIFDDIRIQPFNSTMQTYVYDPEDYSLRYILNNQNYFSEFIRDSEGSLIQKNIETEEGKKTLSINRNNISNN